MRTNSGGVMKVLLTQLTSKGWLEWVKDVHVFFPVKSVFLKNETQITRTRLSTSLMLGRWMILQVHFRLLYLLQTCFSKAWCEKIWSAGNYAVFVPYHVSLSCIYIAYLVTIFDEKLNFNIWVGDNFWRQDTSFEKGLNFCARWLSIFEISKHYRNFC